MVSEKEVKYLDQTFCTNTVIVHSARRMLDLIYIQECFLSNRVLIEESLPSNVPSIPKMIKQSQQRIGPIFRRTVAIHFWLLCLVFLLDTRLVIL